jgi:hypothetical protein
MTIPVKMVHRKRNRKSYPVVYTGSLIARKQKERRAAVAAKAQAKQLASQQAEAAAMRVISVALPLGIGDVHWCAQKFVGLRAFYPGKPLHCYVNESPNHKTVEYLKLLSVVDEAYQSNRAPYDIIRELPGTYKDPKYATLRGSRNWRDFSFVFVANAHVEAGKHIKDWMPELATEYTLAYKFPTDVHQRCSGLMPHGRTVLLYPSGIGPNYGFHRDWWSPLLWALVVLEFNKYNIIPTFVGANTADDVNYMKSVEGYLKTYECAQYFNAVGKTDMASYIYMIMKARGWMGLNSGGGIVAISVNCPTVMFWADNRFPIKDEMGLTAQNFNPMMQYSWQSAEQLKVYRTLSYGSPSLTPQEAVKQMLEVIRP